MLFQKHMKAWFRIPWLIYLSILDKAKRFATISIYSWHEHIQKNKVTIKSEKDIDQNSGVIILEAHHKANIVRYI